MDKFDDKAVRQPIKCLFVTKIKNTSSLYDFALLTDSFEFYQSSLRTLYRDLTTDLWLKLRKMYNKFQFTKDTTVVITDNIDYFSPIAYYLQILREQIHFDLRFVDKNHIPRRIAQHHLGYLGVRSVTHVTIRHVNALWDQLIEHENCPWITKEVDEALNESYIFYRRRIKYLRLGIYYILILKLAYLSRKNQAERRRVARELSKTVECQQKEQYTT